MPVSARVLSVLFLLLQHHLVRQLASASDSSLQLDLQLAIVVYRHGDRSPIQKYANDRYEEKNWPQGYGQLSPTGMNQQYHLGNLMKERYVTNMSHLSYNYSRLETYIRSTDVDRTLMSAQSQLASLYSPTQYVFESVKWKPVPVHTVSGKNDTLLKPWDNCPRLTELRKKDVETVEYQKMLEENKEFLKNLSIHAGEEINMSNIWVLQDTLFVENASGFGLPEWATEEVMDSLQSIADSTLSLMFSSAEKRRLTSGHFVQKLLADIDGKVHQTSDTKTYFYSAHDTTVASVMSGLGVSDYKQPPYASAFLVELYSSKGKEKNYFIKMLYRNDTFSDAIHELALPWCQNQTACDLETFKTFASDRVSTDINADCGKTQSSGSGGFSVTMLALLSALAAILLLSLVLMACCFLYRWRKWKRTRDTIKLVYANEEESL